MITPLDIQNKEFAKGVRGYKEDEVNRFLDMITIDYERMMEENRVLKTKITELEKEIEKKRETEESVRDTLETTKSLMRDIAESAEKRAKIVLKNAELDAELIVREARDSIERYREEGEMLKNRYNIFSNKYKALLETELEKFDSLRQELFYENKLQDNSGDLKPLESKDDTIAIHDIDQLF